MIGDQLPTCDQCGAPSTTLYVEDEPGDRLVCGGCFDELVWWQAGGEPPKAEPGATAGDTPEPFHLPAPFS